MSILYAPILEQAGFIKGGGSEPVVNYVARLDGATRYWTLTSPIQVPAGWSIQFNLYRPIGSTGVNEYVLSGESNTNTAAYYGGESNLFLGSYGYLTNLMVDELDNNILPADGQFHSVSVESSNQSAELKNLGCRFSFERLLSGAFTDLIVKDAQGVITNHIPLTNKAQGATQLATIGSVNAFMPNYSSDVWEIAP